MRRESTIGFHCMIHHHSITCSFQPNTPSSIASIHKDLTINLELNLTLLPKTSNVTCHKYLCHGQIQHHTHVLDWLSVFCPLHRGESKTAVSFSSRNGYSVNPKGGQTCSLRSCHEPSSMALILLAWPALYAARARSFCCLQLTPESRQCMLYDDQSIKRGGYA